MFISNFLDPKNDLAFKRVFGTEENKDILIHFINDIQGFTGDRKIDSVEFLPTEQNPISIYHKFSVLDVLCKDRSGRQIMVEMQVAFDLSFEKRAQYYVAKSYCRQLRKGEAYDKLKEVIFIAILDYVLFENKTSYKSEHVILDRDTHEHDLKDFSFTFIELPKFNKNKVKDLQNVLEKWSYFFKFSREMSEKDLEYLISKDFVISKAYDVLSRASWSEDQLFHYEQAEKRIMDSDNAMKGLMLRVAKEEIEKGIAAGREEGIMLGREEGKKEGIILGKEEGKKEGIAEGREEGIAAGIELGLEQGVQEGVDEGMKRGVSKGIRKGIKEGMKDGVVLGKKEGFEEGVRLGKEELLAKQKRIVLELLKRELDHESISSITGLSIIEIKKLIN